MADIERRWAQSARAAEARPLAGRAPSTLLTITLAAIYPKQTLESSVKFRDCAKTRDVSIM